MAKRTIPVASVNVITHVFLGNSAATDGSGLTGLNDASPNIALYWMRDGDANDVQLTLANGTVGTWASGSFTEVSSSNMEGIYEVGMPDAAWSAGANTVIAEITGDNIVPTPMEFEIDGAAQAVFAKTIDGGVNFTQVQTGVLAFTAGIRDGANTATVNFYRQDGTNAAISLTNVDTFGNSNTVVLGLT